MKVKSIINIFEITNQLNPVGLAILVVDTLFYFPLFMDWCLATIKFGIPMCQEKYSCVGMN